MYGLYLRAVRCRHRADAPRQPEQFHPHDHCSTCTRDRGIARRRGALWRAAAHELLVKLVNKAGALHQEIRLGIGSDNRVSRCWSAAGRCRVRQNSDCGRIASPRSAPNVPAEIAKKPAPQPPRRSTHHLAGCFACHAPPGPSGLQSHGKPLAYRCEEDGPAVLQSNFSIGKCVTTVVRRRNF
jgi:hypothetical protein